MVNKVTNSSDQSLQETPGGGREGRVGGIPNSPDRDMIKQIHMYYRGNTSHVHT